MPASHFPINYAERIDKYIKFSAHRIPRIASGPNMESSETNANNKRPASELFEEDCDAASKPTKTDDGAPVKKHTLDSDEEDSADDEK